MLYTRTHRRPSMRRRGFSLAELMVVIVILGLLATLVVPSVVDKLKGAQRGKARTDITVLANALDDYAVHNSGRYPESLEILVTPDANGHTYLKQRQVPRDPWGNEYQYEPPYAGEPRPRVYTLGRDNAVGGEGEDADLDNFMILDGRG